MYVAPTIQGLTQPIINPQSVPQNFQYMVVTPDQELNALTPTLAMEAANQFVKGLEKNNFIRTNAYNKVAVNNFANDQFRGFIGFCIRAALVAFETQQTNSIRDVMSRLLPDWINMFSAGQAVTSGNLHGLDANTMQTMQREAQRYVYWVKDTEQKSLLVAQNMLARNGQMFQPGQWFNFMAINNNQPTQYGTNFANPGVPPSQMMIGNSGLGVGGLNQEPQISTMADSIGSPKTGYYSKKLAEEKAQQQQQHIPYMGINPNGGSEIQIVESSTSVMDNTAYVSPWKKKLDQEMADQAAHQSHGRWGTLEQTNAPMNTQKPSIPAPPPPTSMAATMPPAAHDIALKAAHATASAAQVQDFDQDILDFTRDPTPVKVVAPTVQTHLEKKKPILKETTYNGHKLTIVSMLIDRNAKEAGWKPSKYQTHFPAWCQRTHELIFVIADTDEVIAVPTPYEKEKDLEKMFNYEAHGINPNMGKPARDIAIPVREEAKVLYAKDPKDVRIQVKNEVLASSDTNELTQMARMDAVPSFNKDKNMMMSVVKGHNYEYLGFIDEEQAKQAFEEIHKVQLTVTYDSCAAAINDISNPVIRQKLDKIFTTRFNELIKDRLGVDGYVDSFVDEATGASEMIRSEMGDLLADAMVEAQPMFIEETIKVVCAEEVPEFASSVYCGNAEDLEIFMKNSLFLITNHLVMTSRFTGDELAIGLGDGASQLDAECYPVLHKAITQALESDIVKEDLYTTITLQSIDGAKYNIMRSPLNPETILIKSL